MKEIKEIIKAYNDCVAAGKKAALAAVVHLDGSSYRRPGARMLINDEGQLTGAISGGCLEGDALRKALLVIAQQNSKLVTYDTTDEEDVSVGVQLGCAGIIQVLFEPIDVNAKINPIKLLQKAISKKQKSVLVTLFSTEEKNKPQIGTCLLVEEDKTITGEIPVAAIKDAVMKDIQTVIESQLSAFINYDSEGITYTAFIEFLQPPISLVVVGAGNDAIPMVNIADSIGWEVRVVDGRNTHAKPERFVSACQVLVSKPENALEQISIDEQTVFVLMTHNYNYDLAMLRALLEHNVKYIGVLGPKKKLERMLEELKDAGMKLTDKQMNSVYGPVGLEIGAETAEEIALSIIAEIKSVFAGKKGTSLRDSKDFIHSRLDTRIENREMSQ
jgi:xanthine/CO dehydrogenase XdhC/CoxF family maturation factor